MKEKNNQLTTFLACYDSGGQAEFFDILPALITVSTGNIMVFDMSKCLYSKIQSENYEKGNCLSEHTTHQTTVDLMNIALAIFNTTPLKVLSFYLKKCSHLQMHNSSK